VFCKSCQYPLWNLAPGLCPECGSPFHPSDFDFVPNAVRFLCPHCHQDYYGTDPRGHLSPRAFDCVRCRRHISMDEMLLLPTAGVGEKETQPEPMPWLDKSYGNAVKRWWGTAWRGALTPGRLLRATPAQSTPGRALKFASINLFGPGLVGLAFLLLLTFAAPGPGPMIFLAVAAGGLLLLFVLFLLWSLLAHAILAATGAHEHTLRRTVQAFGYTSGIALLVAIPCLGFYALVPAAIWWSVTAILAMQEAHRSERHPVGIARILAAVLIPPVALATILTCLWVFVFLPAIQRSMTAAMRTAAATAGPGSIGYGSLGAVRAGTLASALQSALARDGAYPASAALLVRESGVNPNDFIIATSADPLAGDNLGIGSLPLTQFKTAAPDRAQAVIAALGPAPSPERIGEVVFTFHDIPAAATNPQLWLFITDPEPASSGPGAMKVRHVGQLDGTVRSFDAAALPSWLAMENARRAAEGLPALPDPDTVK
jgi:hypothetical protein